jgi:hypothetical protein
LVVSMFSATTFADHIPGTNPVIRREFRTLNDTEKLDFVEAVQCLGRSPSKLGLNTTRYEDFVWFHLQAYLNCE